METTQDNFLRYRELQTQLIFGHLTDTEDVEYRALLNVFAPIEAEENESEY